MKIKTTFFLLMFLMSFSLRAQTMREMSRLDTDSMWNALQILEGSDKIDVLNLLALKLSPAHFDSSILLTARARELAQKIDYHKGIADALYVNGVNNILHDSLKASISNFLDALQMYEELEPCMWKAFTLDQLQAINFLVGRYEKSKKYARQACYLYNYFQDTIYEATMTFTMALTCTEMLEFDSASYYNKKALELLGNRQDNESLGYKASIYLDEGYNIGHEISITGNESRRLESIHWYLEGLRISEKIENPMLICLFLSNLSYAYSTLGSDDSLKKGIDFAHRLLSISENLKIRLSLILHAYKRLAIIEYENGNVKEAIYLLNEGLQKLDQRMKSFSVSDYPSPQTILWDRHYYLVELKRAYKFFYSIYLEQKDFEKALEYYILMDETETEIRQKDNQNLVVMLEAEYKNEKTESRIAGLEKEREISELRASQSRYFNIGLGIFIIVLLLVSLLFIRQNKIKNEHRSTLLEQKLLRLQMNPHFIFNALSSIHSLMNPKDVGRASAYLGNFSSLLRSTLESSREDYILLEEEISAIRNYLELQSMRFHNKFKYTIDVDPGINLEAAIIPPMLIQPFIENAIEHGIRNKQDKGQVNVRFRLQQNMIICEIEDDGVGRKKAWETAYTQKGKHRSLATDIIHERIRILNRKFRLKIDLDIIDLNSGSGRPSGTLVKLDLPYILD